MWGNLLDRGKELAAQAQRAAEELDKHLNESVGVAATATTTTTTKVVDDSNGQKHQQEQEYSDDGNGEDDDALDDSNWDEEEDPQLAAAAAATPMAATSRSTVSLEQGVPTNEELATDPKGDNDDKKEIESVMEKHEAVEEAVVEGESGAVPPREKHVPVPPPHNGRVDRDDSVPPEEETDTPPTTAITTEMASEHPDWFPNEPVAHSDIGIAASLVLTEEEAKKDNDDDEALVDDSDNGSSAAAEKMPGFAVSFLGNLSTLVQQTLSTDEEDLQLVDAAEEHQEATGDAEQRLNAETVIVPQHEMAEEVQRTGEYIAAVAPFAEASIETERTQGLQQDSDLPVPLPSAAVEETLTENDDAIVDAMDEPPESEKQNPTLVPSTALHLESILDNALDSQAAAFNENQPQEQLVQQKIDYARILEEKLEDMQQRLSQREEQLMSKTEQLAMIETMHESEREELTAKVQSTKEEAKRRIQKAKERVDAVELKLKNISASQSSTVEDAERQAEIVTALRSEGEKLARKQADMEASVRAAKAEARESQGTLEETRLSLEKATVKIATLEVDLKATRDDLSSARHGESQAGKLDSDLRNSREESEMRALTILSLEQTVKELKGSESGLRNELAEARKGAAVETEQERKKLIVEHNHLVSDLETKLRSVERDAVVREDALRNEVDELRKRWQDAVRRADSLSVDVQSSTAPLLRQLESANKQSRSRAVAWTELETQLRAELEENVILNEQLTKERSELKTKCMRLERLAKENELELNQLKGELRDKNETVQKLEHTLTNMETEGARLKSEWAEVERLANEGVSRVRSEMSRTVVDSEERHRTQLEGLDSRLRLEKEQRSLLEQQVQDLLDNTGVLVPANSGPMMSIMKEPTPKKLRKSQGQAEILAGALGGLGGDEEEYDEYDNNDDDGDVGQSNGSSSFAALEQLTSSLKASKIELTTLRSRLSESEKTRDDLVQILAESRNAREKLPLFEARVQELTVENRDLALEVQGLQEDIADARVLYRSQMNALLDAHTVDFDKPSIDSPSEPLDNNSASTDVAALQIGANTVEVGGDNSAL